MKIIHTSDIHLDASFATEGMPAGFGARRRQGLRDTLSAILRRAAEWPADAVLIAGDLFDHERTSRATIAFLREQFESIRPIPIFISPGNRDPFLLTSPYATEAWPANVHIFRTATWGQFTLKHIGLTVHGVACEATTPPDDFFTALEARPDGRVHLALAHATERGHLPPGKAAIAPFDAAAIPRDGLHYAALGHYHAYTPVLAAGPTIAAYSGAPEGLGFHETGPRHYLEVEITPAADGTFKTSLRPVLSSCLVYATHAIDCTRIPDSAALIEELRGLARAATHPQALRATLTGAADPALLADLPAIHDLTSPDFFHLEFRDETHPPEDFDALANENTSLGVFIRRLNNEITDAPDENRRAVLLRAREVGLAGYRGRELPIHGMPKGAV